MDKEYILLNEIEKNENITQRELSRKTELSLGSINILLNKMVHEGLIKIKQIPMNRVAYMLTPAGITEKVRKTSNYIKIHYNYINDATEKIKNALLVIIEQYGDICVLLEHDEISELVKVVVTDIKDKKHIESIEYIVNRKFDIKDNKTLVALSQETYDQLGNRLIKAVNLLELL